MKLLQTKEIVREHYRQIRSNISSERREAASLEVKNHLVEELNSYPFVLSYASFGDELEMDPINRFLVESGKLVLPKIVGRELHCFCVKDLQKDLVKGSWNILEPAIDNCKRVSLDEISCVLVPGLSFDKDHHRIGYGMGFYDRLLTKFDKSVPCIGLGFQEQFCPFSLPTEKTDISLTRLLLL